MRSGVSAPNRTSPLRLLYDRGRESTMIRRGSTDADGRPIEALTALVDGSNLAYDGSVPRIERLTNVRRALEAAGFEAVEVVCDANLHHRFEELNKRDARAFDEGLDSGLWSQSPARVRADEVLLRRLKADSDTVVVSNDAFAKDEDDAYRPDDLDLRHVRVHFQRDGVQLLYPDGWDVPDDGWFATGKGKGKPAPAGTARTQPATTDAPRPSRLRGVPGAFAGIAIQLACLTVLLGSALPWVQVPRFGANDLETRTGFEMGYLTGSGIADGQDGFVVFFAAAVASLLGLLFAMAPRSWLALLIAAFGAVVVLISGYDWVRLQLLDPQSELAGRSCNPACVLGGTYLTLGAGLLLVVIALVSRWVIVARRRR